MVCVDDSFVVCTRAIFVDKSSSWKSLEMSVPLCEMQHDTSLSPISSHLLVYDVQAPLEMLNESN